MAYSFSGGISLKTENKTGSLPSKPFAEPTQVALPLSGCLPAVSVGDFVDIGTCVGFGKTEDCPPVHASVSGTVIAIEKRGEDTHVVIKNDCRHTVVSGLDPVTKPLGEIKPEEIIARARNAGIVDAVSGKSLASLLRAAMGKAKRLVINCTESQGYESTSYRVMAEQTEAVIKGAKLIIYALGLRKADLVIEEKRDKLVSRVEERITCKELIDVKQTTSKHPISVPARLIYAVYGKRVPLGGSPLDVGYVVISPETAANLYRALATGMPMIHKRITVSGDAIKTPLNLVVPVGTSIKDIAELCGGTKKRFKRIVKGGILMGYTVGEVAVVEKTDDSVLFLSSAKAERSGCVRCGRCIDTCPVGLTPALLATYSEKQLHSEALALGAEHCIGCGCCSYVCPSGIPIAALIKKTLKKGRDDGEQA